MKWAFILLLLPSFLGAAESLDAWNEWSPKRAPGSTIKVADGSHTTKGYLKLENIRGTEEKPITIRAEHRGKSVVTGKAGFSLKDCEHVILEGFVFENDANQQAVLLENCRHVRITRCTFRLSENEKSRWGQYWVHVLGNRSGHNRIDHNLFERQKNRGSMVFVRGDDATLTPSQHDRVDHNHFCDVIYANDANGHETLRTGSNDMGASGKSTFTTIEDNLLERCSGEQEIISLKSSGNIVRRNTFIDCRGCICLRLGHRSEIDGNIMLNPGGVAGAGGVKIYGVEHRITNNYFHGLTGTGHESPLVLVPGTMETETTDQIYKSYQDFTTTPATRVTISNNTWMDCGMLLFGDLKLNKDHPFTPNACVFTPNTVIHTKTMKTPLVRLGFMRELKAENNRAFTEKPPIDQSWAVWFQWAKEKPAVAVPKPLTPAEVGPDAP